MSSYRTACVISDFCNQVKPGSAIVAGGYLRDMELGRDPKDVDVLIHREGACVEDILALCEMHGYSSNNKFQRGEGYPEGDDQLCGLIDLEKEGELKIDLVFLTVPVIERFDNFPCSLCKIYRHQVTHEIIKALDFVESVNSKCLIFYRRTLMEPYKRKMIEYFPEWEYVEVGVAPVPNKIEDLPLFGWNPNVIAWDDIAF